MQNLIKYLYLIISVFQTVILFSQEKIEGICLVSSNSVLASEHVLPITKMGSNHVAVIPFAFMPKVNQGAIKFNTKNQWYGETEEGVKQQIIALKKQGLKVMLKPQIWVWNGAYTGYIKMENEEAWKAMEQAYLDYILFYAKIAEESKSELYCIGTELEQFVANRPLFWVELIKQVREIYSGKLTYAANWDEYSSVSFWAQLDYVGVDAYFPVCDSKTPTVKACIDGWKRHLQRLKSLSIRVEKPILFTEFGYRSIDYAAKEPWDSGSNTKKANLEAQSNATHALFEIFWSEDMVCWGIRVEMAPRS